MDVTVIDQKTLRGVLLIHMLGKVPMPDDFLKAQAVQLADRFLPDETGWCHTNMLYPGYEDFNLGCQINVALLPDFLEDDWYQADWGKIALNKYRKRHGHDPKLVCVALGACDPGSNKAIIGRSYATIGKDGVSIAFEKSIAV
jgi:hypothetical protein